MSICLSSLSSLLLEFGFDCLALETASLASWKSEREEQRRLSLEPGLFKLDGTHGSICQGGAVWPFCVVLGKPIIRDLEAALSMTHVHTWLRILDPNPPCLSPLYRGGKLRPREKQAPQVPQGMASTKPQVSGFLLHSSLASRLLLPKPCQLTLARRETRIRKVTRESKTGARPFCVRLCRSWSFVGLQLCLPGTLTLFIHLPCRAST